MISLRVFVCVILSVWGLDYVRAHQWNEFEWNRQINFVYKKRDILKINIILRNKPPNANNYALFYKNEVGDITMIPSDNTIDFTMPLIGQNFTLEMQVLEDYRICSSKKIMYGKIADGDNSSAEEDEEQFEAACLNMKDSPCRIIVDFREEVDKAQTADEINCRRHDSRYTCEPTCKNLPPDTEHQWYQRDENDTFIGIIPKVKGKWTIFEFVIQKFDEKSFVFLNSKVLNNNQLYFIHKNFENKSPYYSSYIITSTKHFSENKEFNFTCSKFARAQIGLIDPTGYKITTYDYTSLLMNFNKADSGSMLCCLHYNITYLDRHSEVAVVERIVRNITLLIYKEAVNHDHGEATTTPEQSSSTSAIPSHTTPRINSIEDERKNTLKLAPAQTSTESPYTPTSSEPAASVEDTRKTHQLNGPAQSSDKTKYYIAMVSAAGAILFVSLIYVIVKKCSRKAQDPEKTLQLETYASTNMVYAELDIRPGKVPMAPTTEDTTYAEIIGVLRPRNEYVKK